MMCLIVLGVNLIYLIDRYEDYNSKIQYIYTLYYNNYNLKTSMQRVLPRDRS